MSFEIVWASLIVGSKFTVFALFFFVFESNFPSASPPPGGGGAYIWRDDLTGAFCVTSLGGLHMEGLISEFYGMLWFNFISGLNFIFLCVSNSLL